MGYVSVIIDQNSRYTDSMFTYRAPDCVAPGAVVRVPFNKGNREKRGFVVETCTKPDIDEVKIKDIISVEDSVSIAPEAVGTCMWMRQRYGIKYIDAIRCFIPPGKPPKLPMPRPSRSRNYSGASLSSDGAFVLCMWCMDAGASTK